MASSVPDRFMPPHSMYFFSCGTNSMLGRNARNLLERLPASGGFDEAYGNDSSAILSSDGLKPSSSSTFIDIVEPIKGK